MGPITLLAMAPSGETYLAADGSGRVWLIQPPGAGEPELVDPGLVDRAVALGGFDRVDAQLNSWAELDRFRQERAAELVPAVVVEADRLDRDDIEEMLEIAEQWVQEGEAGRAQRALLALLRLEVVRADKELHEQIVNLFERVVQTPTPFGTEPATERQRAARARLAQVNDPGRLAA